MQAGDVPATYAAIDRIAAATGFVPHTQLADGLARFVAWYRSYHGLPAGDVRIDVGPGRFEGPIAADVSVIVVTGGPGAALQSACRVGRSPTIPTPDSP